ncbi:MHO_4530 family protein [Mycoplasma sp. 327]
MLIWIIAFSSIIFIFSFWFILFLIRTQNNIKNESGFLCLEIDLKQNRIKHLNGIPNISNEPTFIKKLNLLNNKWRKLDDLCEILEKKYKLLFLSALKNKENTIISFETTHNKHSTYKTKVSFEINFINDQKAFMTVNWNRNDTIKNEVFEALNTNISYLFSPNSKYIACGFILNIKNINSINNFIKLFQDSCVYNQIKGVKVFLDWNKIFFVFPSDRFQSGHSYYATKIFANTATLYKNLYSTFFSFNNELLTNKNQLYYETVFDFVKTLTPMVDYWIPNNIEDNKDFKIFKEKYEYTLDEIKQSNNIDFKTVSINNFGDENTKLNLLLIKRKFEILNIKDENIIASLDIYKNFFMQIYENIKSQDIHGKVLNIQDFIFNYIDNKSIENSIKIDRSFVQLVSLNSKKSMLRVKKKIEQIKENYPKAAIGIKLTEINNDIISLIGKWVGIIWFDKSLTKMLNNPETMLYIGLILKKAEHLKISIVFENLDFKNYKKVLFNKKIKMFYSSERKK